MPTYIPNQYLDEFGDYIAAREICATGTCAGLADYGFEPGGEIPKYYLLIKLAKKKDTALTSDQDTTDMVSNILNSPFDLLDENLPEMEKVRRLIDYVRAESKIRFAQTLADRLEDLHNGAVEEDDEPISSASLRHFIHLLQNTPSLKCPEVVLAPSNEIRAQWRVANNRHFAATFLQTGETRFVIFTPNSNDPDQIDRLSGVTSVDTLIDVARPHNILQWAAAS